MARPTKAETALKRWEELETEVMADLPILIKKALGRVKKMLDDDKAKNSDILRACDQLIKLWRSLEEDRLDIAEGFIEAAKKTAEEEKATEAEIEKMIEEDEYQYIEGIEEQVVTKNTINSQTAKKENPAEDTFNADEHDFL